MKKNDGARLCRKSPPWARERAIFLPGNDDEAGDIGFIVDGAGSSQGNNSGCLCPTEGCDGSRKTAKEKGPLEARASFLPEPWILLALLAALWPFTGYADEPLLHDGFHIQAANGTLILDTDTGTWSFRFNTDLSDGKHTVSRQKRYPLLPSRVLEELLHDQQARATLEYRLWAKVTRYRGTNYLYVTHFLPLRQIRTEPPREEKTAEPHPSGTPAPDALNIPETIEQDRQARRLVDRPIPDQTSFSPPDGLLLSRVGYVRSQENEAEFVLDGLGRSINPRHFNLLPNQLLDSLQQQQADALDRLHFRTVGLTTVYRGHTYLLLINATRVYDYGNFGK